jgi:osmotically inducible protein OsmC
VVKSHIVLNATIPGIGKEQFDECVANAKQNCPISKLLNAEISVEATLA